MTDSSGDRNPAELLAEEFIARKRRGEKPSLSEYTEKYPELARDIRDVFPALVMMENLADSSLADTGPHGGGEPALKQLGDYRILREVGRGGMGVVYEAEQQSLGRRVALKVLPPHALNDAQQVRRFEREAKAAARLHHTNIVPVYGVGRHDGTHFYVMQFIQGLGLDGVLEELRQLRGGKARQPVPDAQAVRAPVQQVAHSLMTGSFHRDGPSCGADGEAAPSTATGRPSDSSVPRLPDGSDLSSASGSDARYWRSVARIGVQVADALDYAHGQGILHRDVKPSNLLMDMKGTVWVTDFGLAKGGDAENLTHTGDIVGTIRYMAPERFQGKSDVRSDLYSLGMTLYELLTLRPAFDEADRNKLVAQVMHGEPPRPRQLNPAVPRDLETIVLKAIDCDPARRYQTAPELADDLKRFMEDRPIRARRVTLHERAWRWCRRNPAVASLAAAVATLLVAAAVGATAAAFYFGEQAETEKRLKTDAEQAKANAEDKEKETRRTLTDSYTALGLAAGARDDPRQAVLWFAYAARLAGDDRERADANRTRAAAWGRQALQPVRAFVHPAEWIENNMAFHPGGRHLLTHGFDPATGKTDCRLWDVEREAALPFPGNPSVVSTAVWDTTGQRLAVGTPQGEVTICRFPSGELVQRVPYAGRIARLLFSPDGRYCALAAANRVRVWDCRQGAFATPELEHPAAISTLAFHPQGELLATGCQDHTCRVFAVPAEKNTPLFMPVPHGPGVVLQGSLRAIGISPIPPLFLDDGRGLLTLSQDEGSCCNSRTGQFLRVLRLAEPGPGEKFFSAIALGRDGKHVVLAGQFSDRPHARICAVAAAQPVSPNLEHRAMQAIFSAAFSPDGRTLLTGSGDHTARLWSVPEGTPLGGPLTHPTSVTGVAFAPDGRHLATVQRGGLIRLWALPAGIVGQVANLPWDGMAGQRPAPLPTGNPHDYRVAVGAQSFVRLSHDGRFLVPTGLSRHTCELRSTQVFDLTTGQRVGPPLEANGFILDAAFSPDGLQVAAAISRGASPAERRAQQGQQPGQLLLWDWRAGKLQHEPLPLASEPRKVDYSSDGRQLAVICAKGELVVLDPATGKTLRQWQAHPPSYDTGSYTGAA